MRSLMLILMILFPFVEACISDQKTIWLCNNTMADWDDLKLRLNQKDVKFISFIESGSDIKVEVEEKYKESSLECGFAVCDSVNKEIIALRETEQKAFYQIFNEQSKYDTSAKGIQIYFYYDGNNYGRKSSSGEFKNGMNDGKWIYWYRNSNIAQEGKYKDGLKEGEWKYYNEASGKLSWIIQYNKNKLVNWKHIGE